MNPRTRVTLLSVVTALAGAGCVSGNLPPQQQATADGSTAQDVGGSSSGSGSSDSGNGSSSGSSGSNGGSGGGGDGGAATTATLFVADDIDNLVYRYNLTPGGAAPVLTGTIADNSAYAPAIRSTGELFVGNYLAAGTINRFLSPLGTPIANGAISNVGLSYPNTMLFVDDELWVPNSTAGCGSDPSTLVRLAFDAQGNASVAGTVTSGMTGADRGIAWDPTTRSLFVSQCTPIDTIQHYQVAADHTVTALAPISGNGLHNPGGMIVTPWGELLVANEGTASSSIHGASLLRFSLGAQGSVTANGTITGQGLDSPFGLAFAPWGDLFVMSNSNAMLARFAFDASHAATQSGSYQLATPQNNAIYRGTAAIAIAPGASMPSAGGGADGSVADTGSDASAE